MQVGVAIDIPEPWGGRLTRRRAEAGDPVADHVPAHLTLLSPTEVDPGRLGEIDEQLSEVAAGHSPYPLLLRGTGTFRPLTQVVFVAVAAGISECERLAGAVRALPALHRPERFPYHPHVTVAQDVPTPALDAVFDDLAGFEARFEVHGFTLFEHEPAGGWRARRDFRLAGA